MRWPRKGREEARVNDEFSTRLRLLPASEMTEGMIKGVEMAGGGKAKDLAALLRPGLIELPEADMKVLGGWLNEGRLPKPGRDEVLAGFQARQGDRLSVAGRTLSVVGVLQPSIALFADSYLIPADPESRRHLSKGRRRSQTRHGHSACAASSATRKHRPRSQRLTRHRRSPCLFPTSERSASHFSCTWEVRLFSSWAERDC